MKVMNTDSALLLRMLPIPSPNHLKPQNHAHQRMKSSFQKSLSMPSIKILLPSRLVMNLNSWSTLLVLHIQKSAGRDTDEIWLKPRMSEPALNHVNPGFWSRKTPDTKLVFAPLKPRTLVVSRLLKSRSVSCLSQVQPTLSSALLLTRPP